MNEQKVYQRHQNWIFWLTGAWLIATFEHNYYTLSQYSLGKIWNIFGTAIPISDIATILLVLALELTLFWSVSFIPAGKRWNIRMLFINVIQAVSTFISIVLNVKYMIMASPTNSWMDMWIGGVVGGLIPVFVILFGYVEGHVVDSQIENIENFIFGRSTKRAAVGTGGNGKKVTMEQVYEAKVDDPSLTVRQLAKKFNVSPTTIQHRIDEIHKSHRKEVEDDI